MPSERRQLNVRLSEENEARLDRLVRTMRARLGIAVSKSDAIQAGLVELEKRYPAEAPEPEADKPSPKKRRKPP
jgi:Arc/MetJ-type ribon-helix-helix transcriptional regulator